MNVLGIWVVESASEMRDERRVAVLIDSFPPFRIAAFPEDQISSNSSVRGSSSKFGVGLTRLDGKGGDIDHDLGSGFEDNKQHSDRASHTM